MSDTYTADQLHEKIQEVTKRVEDHYEDQLRQMDAKIKSYEEMVENEDKLSNLRGWAVDRAIQICKIGVDITQPSFEEVRDLAEKLAHYTYGKDYTNTVTKQ